MRSRSGNSLAVRHVIEGPLQLWMLLDILTDFVQALTRGLEALLKLRLGLHLGLPKRHLNAAVRIDLAFARSFDRKEDHVLELIDHGGLHPIGLRRRHAPERFQCQYHVAEFMHRVVNVLTDFQVPFAPARELVVEGICQLRQLGLRRKLVRDSAQLLDSAVVEEVPQALARPDSPQFLAQADVIGEVLL